MGENVGICIKGQRKKTTEFDSSFIKEQDIYCVSMEQAPNAIGSPCVKVGDYVSEGTMIARPNNRNGVFVYSPVSGKVSQIIQKLSISGQLVDHVVIVPDKKNKVATLPRPDEINRKTLLERLMISGIVDDDGNADYIKYVRMPGAKTNLIISCVDNDPYISSNGITMKENLEKVYEGIKYYLIILGGDKATLLFTSKQTKLIKKVKQFIKVKNLKKELVVKITNDVYPLSNSEIVYSVTGRVLGESGRVSKGIYVESCVTAKLFAEAVDGKMPVSRLMTINGSGFVRQGNFEVKIGTSLKSIQEHIGATDKNSQYKMIAGGVMTGIAQESNDVSVGLGLNGVVFLTDNEFSEEKESPCIHCGKCVDVCPVRIMPYKVDEYLADNDLDFAVKFGLECCTGCGNCSYICPAKRYLTQRLVLAKNKYKKMRGGQR